MRTSPSLSIVSANGDSGQKIRTMDVCQLLSNRCLLLLEDIARQEGFIKHKLTVIKESEAGENFSSEIYKAIIVDCENEDHSLHLIVKVSLNVSFIKESFIGCVYKREAYVYSRMLPVLDECQKDLPEDERFEFPKMLEAVLDDDESILVIEDLCKRGYRMLDRMIPFDYEHLVVCIKTIARLHATSFVLRAKKPEIYNEIFSNTNNHQKMKDMFGHFVEPNINTIKKLINNEPYQLAIEKVLDDLINEYSRTFDMDRMADYSVHVHGDAWSNNLLFNNKNGKADKMMFIDWQLVRTASPILDLSYALLISIDSKMRTKHYEEMLDLYYEVLSSNVTKMGVDISKCYPYSVYREQIGRYMRFGLIISFGALPVILADKGNAVEITEYYKKLGDVNIRFPISKTCCARWKEIFEDCVKYKII